MDGKEVGTCRWEDVLYLCAWVHHRLRLGLLGVLGVSTAQDVDTWNSCCVWLPTENIVPSLDWYFSLKPGCLNDRGCSCSHTGLLLSLFACATCSIVLPCEGVSGWWVWVGIAAVREWCTVQLPPTMCWLHRQTELSSSGAGWTHPAVDLTTWNCATEQQWVLHKGRP